MNLSNYKYNAIGGIDADRELESGEIVPYSLSESEQGELTEEISGSVEDAIAEIASLTQVSEFKANRQSLIDSAVVDANGFLFDADEVSIGRMASAILAINAEPATFIVAWSLADTPAGVMTNITAGDLILAHQLAVQNMSTVWSI